MKVVSKFLTADVRIVRVRLAGRTMILEGLVKELMPMTVELAPSDLREMLRVASAPVRARIAKRLPARLAAVLTPKGD